MSKKEHVFTSKINFDCPSEIAIYCNGEIFCHVSETDYDIFCKYFAKPIEFIAPKFKPWETESQNE